MAKVDLQSPARRSGGVAEPLRQPVFRRIWLSSLFSNLGQQVQAVAAGWTMVQLAPTPDVVALVQTASMLPIMLIALPAGAIADMYDRRKAAIAAILVALAGATLLAILSFSGLVTPTLLLGCCFIVGAGVALFGPAWQASVSEQVGKEAMPAAIALYAMSSNIARSLGPALGGLVVVMAGTNPAFALNVLLYVPILVALLLWKRRHEPPRLPPEGIARAIRSGLRYVAYSPPIRRVLFRTVATATGVSAIYSLLPLVVRELLRGGADGYGVLLGAFGIGAVGAALGMGAVRHRTSPESAISGAAAMLGAAILVIALSPWLALTALGCLLAGGAWMVSTSTFNIAVQLSAPRWVAGRTLATFQASAAGGLAAGSWIWGHVATQTGVQMALIVAAVLMLVSPVLGLFAALPRSEEVNNETLAPRSEPEVKLDLTGRSGPIIVEVEHRIAVDDAREFYHLIRAIQRSRERDGAYGVSIARDIGDPELWVERFYYPTWHDYLRARPRTTQAEEELHCKVRELHNGPMGIRVRRLLERPFGSVRWKDNAPDYSGSEVLPLTAGTGDGT